LYNFNIASEVNVPLDEINVEVPEILSKDIISLKDVVKGDLYFFMIMIIIYIKSINYFYSLMVNPINISIVSPALTYLYVAIKKLTVEINFWKNDIQALYNIVVRSTFVKNNQISTAAFVEKYNFSKIQSAEEFKKFDSELQTNDEFAKDFVSIYILTTLT